MGQTNELVLIFDCSGLIELTLSLGLVGAWSIGSTSSGGNVVILLISSSTKLSLCAKTDFKFLYKGKLTRASLFGEANFYKGKGVCCLSTLSEPWLRGSLRSKEEPVSALSGGSSVGFPLPEEKTLSSA